MSFRVCLASLVNICTRQTGAKRSEARRGAPFLAAIPRKCIFHYTLYMYCTLYTVQCTVTCMCVLHFIIRSVYVAYPPVHTAACLCVPMYMCVCVRCNSNSVHCAVLHLHKQHSIRNSQIFAIRRSKLRRKFTFCVCVSLRFRHRLVSNYATSHSQCTQSTYTHASVCLGVLVCMCVSKQMLTGQTNGQPIAI